jgi:hypothetical protein
VGLRATEGTDDRVYFLFVERENNLGPWPFSGLMQTLSKPPKTACLTSCSHKSPSAQTDHTGLDGGQLTTQKWKHRAIRCPVALVIDWQAQASKLKALGESLSGARGQLRHGNEGNRMGNHCLSYVSSIVR